MTTYLLDANVLIALTIREHEHFSRASRWFSTVESAALCPVVEGALMRYAVRIGVPAKSVQALLSALYEDPRIRFWADDVSYADVAMTHVIGHRQVTDTYLTALAAHHDGILATLDAARHADGPEATLLIPV